MGYITHVFAWAANDVGEKAADHFYPISVIEKEEILNKCREIGICGICSIASDVAVITVNYVAEKMGLSGNSVNSTGKCTNKHLMRIAFEENGDPSPKSILVDEKTKLVIEYREKYPETTLQELADIISLETDVVITKSGINHHFRKIKELVERHKNK